jgi:hypothetical protein
MTIYRISGQFSIDIEADSEEDALEIYSDGAYDASELDLEEDEIVNIYDKHTCCAACKHHNIDHPVVNRELIWCDMFAVELHRNNVCTMWVKR